MRLHRFIAVPWRRRAAQLDIEVVEWDDLQLDSLVARLKARRMR